MGGLGIRACLTLGLLTLFATFGMAENGTLVEATRAGDQGSVAALLAAGEEVDRTDADGFTALHWAATLGDIEIVRQLIAAGADIEKRGPREETPLILARAAPGKDSRGRSDHPARGVIAGSFPKVEMLLGHGLDPNAPDVNGDTPLHYAAYYGHDEISRPLDAEGADRTLTNRGAYTPADLARRAGHETLAAELLN